MPDIPVGGQIFDLIFHPKESLVFTGLLSGEVKAFRYDDDGTHERTFSVRPSKRSCRALAIAEDGRRLWAAGKGKAIHTIDTVTGTVIDTRAGAHDVAINRVKYLQPHLLSTGDDDGVIKLWDPRKKDAIRSYTHHFDFISDFLWLEDGRQLVSTSGDGTLSVIDVRSKKTEPLAQSEDQEDELLSIVQIKGGQKFAVGTQLGILSIFNRRNGWGDCVDRIPGHPHSIDTLCNLPAHYPSSHSTVLTGSSDGLLRAVQLFPTKLLGVIADHGEFPVECVAVDRAGQGHWVGSAGHEEVLKMTDLREVLEDEDDEVGKGEKSSGSGSEGSDEDNDEHSDDGKHMMKTKTQRKENETDAKPEEGEEEEEKEDKQDADADSSEDEEAVLERKKRKRKEKDPFQAVKKKRGRNDVEAESSFFADL